MTEAQIRDFLTTFCVQGTDKKLFSYLHSIENTPEPTLVFEAPPSEVAIVDAARRHVGDVLGVKTLLTVHRAAPKSGAASAAPRHSSSKTKLPGIRHVVAIASGKGGVGKSTTAVNLAISFSHLGYRVGLTDADVYGPSVPKMMGLHEKPGATGDKKLIPLERYGVKCMSIGFMVDQNAPVIWRGPMVQNAVQQMIKSVDWGELDLLLIDMPPGTGDAHLTIAQQIELSGAVIVSTPQDIALIDARKGLNMFRQVGVPVLGIIENMSHFRCPNCGHDTDIFSHGGAQREAETLQTPFLGELPIDLSIRMGGDTGQPVAAQSPDAPMAGHYRDIALKIWSNLERI